MANPIKLIVKASLRQIYRVYPFRYRRVIWLIGSGRSGTTWISAMLNHEKTFRELFEPFHPLSRDFGYLRSHHYLRPDDDNTRLNRDARNVFKGQYYNSRVEAANAVWRTLFGGYKHLLVKDVFANLLAFNQLKKNPEVRTILLIRNPFATCISKNERKHWHWIRDPRYFIQDTRLMEDFLEPYRVLINQVADSGSELDKLIAVWCIINYVPLKQFPEDELCVSFYEDWILDPVAEMNRVQEFVDMPELLNRSLADHPVYKQASHSSKGIAGEIDSWRRKLSDEEIASGQKILETFGMGSFYNELSVPSRKALNAFRAQR